MELAGQINCLISGLYHTFFRKSSGSIKSYLLGADGFHSQRKVRTMGSLKGGHRRPKSPS